MIRCIVCNRPLREERSVASSVGPCCAARIGREAVSGKLSAPETEQQATERDAEIQPAWFSAKELGLIPCTTHPHGCRCRFDWCDASCPECVAHGCFTSYVEDDRTIPLIPSHWKIKTRFKEGTQVA